MTDYPDLPARISPEGHIAQRFSEDAARPRRWLCMKWTGLLTAEWLADDDVADWTPLEPKRHLYAVGAFDVVPGIKSVAVAIERDPEAAGIPVGFEQVVFEALAAKYGEHRKASG